MTNMTHEQLVEKVSKAICMANCHNPDAVLTDNLDHSKWEIYVPDARAAIATIAEETKEPTEAMIEAKAKAATPGCWKHHAVFTSDGTELKRDEVRDSCRRVVIEDVNAGEDAAHIARMDPPTTLAIVARIRELEAKAATDLADYETSLETMTAAHEAKVRELEAENAKLKYDISAYVEANSDLLEECDAARGRALEEAASLVDEYGADANHVTSNWAAGIAADIRSLITKEGE